MTGQLDGLQFGQWVLWMLLCDQPEVCDWPVVGCVRHEVAGGILGRGPWVSAVLIEACINLC